MPTPPPWPDRAQLASNSERGGDGSGALVGAVRPPRRARLGQQLRAVVPRSSAVTGNVGGVASTTWVAGSRRLRWMAERVQVRDLTNDEGSKLLAIVRRGSGSVVRWRRAQIVLWSAQGMDVPAIAKIAFTSEDRVRAVIHNFNADGFDSLAPKYAGGRPPTFTLPQRREIKKIALSRPTRSRPAVLDVVAVQAGRVLGR